MAARNQVTPSIPDAGWFTYPVIEGVMERINGFVAYAVGGAVFGFIGPLENQPVPYARIVPTLTNVIQQLEVFLNPTSTIVELPLSQEVARALLNTWKPMISVEAIQLRAQTDLTEQEITAFRWAAQHFTSVLFAELPQADIYYISQKRAYKMSMFLAKAENVLPKSALEFLSPRTITDIREAGRCIAFDQHTAAGFHAVRAVEAVARRYYEQVMNTLATVDGTSAGKPMRLYKLVEALQKKCGTLPAPLEHPLCLISGDLDRIRAVYRNPIMHPEMILTDDQAVRVFNITTDVIAAMIADVQAGGTHFARTIFLPHLNGQF